MKNDRLIRDMELRIAKNEGEETSYRVEGYASTFEPYLMWKDPETKIEYFEQIDPHAFDSTDMSDVVLRIDHEGKVYARTSANDLFVSVDDHGLKTMADLSRTAEGRSLFESIAAGHYPKMSFAFTVSGDDFNKETHTRIITKVAKLYDVSPVSFPANPGTELDVSTRDYFTGVSEVERAERLVREEREAKKTELTARIERLKNGNQRNE